MILSLKYSTKFSGIYSEEIEYPTSNTFQPERVTQRVDFRGKSRRIIVLSVRMKTVSQGVEVPEVSLPIKETSSGVSSRPKTDRTDTK